MKAATILFLFAFLFSACQPIAMPTVQAEPTATAGPMPVSLPSPIEIAGRVIDLNGNPIAGATATNGTGRAESDDHGWFHLAGTARPQWVTVTSPGYISRTRAAAPGTPVLFRLTPNDGKTVVIHFVGDVMFGRRFFDPNEDGDTSDGLLPVNPGVKDHLALLAPIQPLLSNADLTVANLESPLSDQPYISPRDPRPLVYHSTKTYVFASHPTAVQALLEAGVDLVDLGNNHQYDLLEDGLDYTIQRLDQAGLKHFGAGPNEIAAWQPAVVPFPGQKVAFIGCTTISKPIPPVSKNDISYTASDVFGKGGAAACDAYTLRKAIRFAKGDNHVVVAMIHGGFEYDANPSPNVAKMIEAARQAGADLIIDHHAHVVGGLSWNGSTLAAYSLGNFIFDQTVWPTFESYLLAVTLREGKIVRVYTEPLMVADYVAKGLSGDMANYVARGAAGRVDGPFVMENGAVEVDFRDQAVTYTYTMTLKGGDAPGQLFQVPPGLWLSGCSGSGKQRFGRDLLWIGNLENQAVDAKGGESLLWMPSKGVAFGRAFAYQGNTGLQMTRGSSNQEDLVSSHLHRVLVTAGDPLTVAGMIRASEGAMASLQISWYSDTKGASSTTATHLIKIDAPDTWQPFRLDVAVPPGMVALGIYLRLAPPAKGAVTTDFDNLRLIKWAPEGTAASPLYDHVMVTGSCEATISQHILPGMDYKIINPQVEMIELSR